MLTKASVETALFIPDSHDAAGKISSWPKPADKVSSAIKFHEKLCDSESRASIPPPNIFNGLSVCSILSESLSH